MIAISASIGERQVEAALDETSQGIEGKLSNVVDRLLNVIEATQIGAYTENASPAKPAGSAYERTFELKRSSRKIHPTGSLRGEWRTDLAYARFVLGRQSEQAAIHRGRWKSVEEVEQQVEQIGPDIIREEFAR